MSWTKDPCPGHKRHLFIQRVHRPTADRVSQRLQIRAGRTRDVDVEVLRGPHVKKPVLTMRRFDDDQIEALRILTVREEEGAVEQMYRPGRDNHRHRLSLEYGRISRVIPISP